MIAARLPVLAAAIAAALGIAACDTLPPPASWFPGAAATAPAPAPAPEQKPEPAPQPSQQPQPEPAPVLPLETPAVADHQLAALGADSLPGPEGLIGLERDVLSALLGPPSFTRRDPPAEVWQYGDRTCFLDVFLYETAGALTVAHVEVRSRSVVQVSDKDCFLRLLAAGRTTRPR